MDENKEQLNGWPRFDLFPRLTACGRFLGRVLALAPAEAEIDYSEHERGAEAMLLREEAFAQPLYDQQTLFDANLSGFGYEVE